MQRGIVESYGDVSRQELDLGHLFGSYMSHLARIIQGDTAQDHASGGLQRHKHGAPVFPMIVRSEVAAAGDRSVEIGLRGTQKKRILSQPYAFPASPLEHVHPPGAGAPLLDLADSRRLKSGVAGSDQC